MISTKNQRISLPGDIKVVGVIRRRVIIFDLSADLCDGDIGSAGRIALINNEKLDIEGPPQPG